MVIILLNQCCYSGCFHRLLTTRNNITYFLFNLQTRGDCRETKIFPMQHWPFYPVIIQPPTRRTTWQNLKVLHWHSLTVKPKESNANTTVINRFRSRLQQLLIILINDLRILAWFCGFMSDQLSFPWKCKQTSSVEMFNEMWNNDPINTNVLCDSLRTSFYKVIVVFHWWLNPSRQCY